MYYIYIIYIYIIYLLAAPVSICVLFGAAVDAAHRDPAPRPCDNTGGRGYVEVDALGVITISRGCFECSFSKKKTCTHRYNRIILVS